MAGDGTVGIKLKAEGEAEFRKALAELNTQFKLLKSEMTLVTSQYDQNDHSAEAVAARSKVLTSQLEAQREKVDQLEKALASATTAYGEGDKRTLSYATQLNLARASVNDLESALESNQGALEETSQSTEGAESASK